MEILTDLIIEIKSYYSGIVSVLPRLGLGIVLSGVLFLILTYSKKRIFNLILKKAEDPLFISFLKRIIGFVNIIFCVLFFIYIIGLQGVAGTILATAGVSAFVIGFAFKDLGENFLAGIIMAFKRPFKVGDVIESNNVVGTILGLNIRDTHLKTVDGKDVFIPNGQILKNPLFNYTIDGYLRKSFIIGVDYGTDIDKARTIIYEAVSKIKGILSEDKKPITSIAEFSASAINIEVQLWLDTLDKEISGIEVRNEAMISVFNALNEAGVNMPGDVLEIKNYKDLPIRSFQEERLEES